MSHFRVDWEGHHNWQMQNGLYHRYDGPSYTSGYVLSWSVGGKRHRLDGPVRINVSGWVAWGLNGREFDDGDHLG